MKEKIPVLAKVTGVILLIFIILFVVLFICNFSDHPISENIADWASFATYLNGTVGLIISIATLVVTIFIAIIVRGLDDERMDEARKFNRERFLQELREKAYSDVSKELDEVKYAVTQKGHITIFRIKTNFESFISHKKYMFPGLDLDKFNNLNEILECFFFEYHNISKIKGYSGMGENGGKSLNDLFIEYNSALAFFHKEMQKYLLDKYEKVG